MPEVLVEATWRSERTFEFGTDAEAEKFRERIGGGGDDALAAIVEAGDVDTSTAELTDFEVIS